MALLYSSLSVSTSTNASLPNLPFFRFYLFPFLSISYSLIELVLIHWKLIPNLFSNSQKPTQKLALSEKNWNVHEIQSLFNSNLKTHLRRWISQEGIVAIWAYFFSCFVLSISRSVFLTVGCFFFSCFVFVKNGSLDKFCDGLAWANRRRGLFFLWSPVILLLWMTKSILYFQVLLLRKSWNLPQWLMK